MRKFSCANRSLGSIETARSRVLLASRMRPACRRVHSEVVDQLLIVRFQLQCPLMRGRRFFVQTCMTGAIAESLK